MDQQERFLALYLQNNEPVVEWVLHSRKIRLLFALNPRTRRLSTLRSFPDDPEQRNTAFAQVVDAYTDLAGRKCPGVL